ncbi:DUF3445 domain-containing protein [Neorhizobium lilium]|uniref:DUF3445 domain-containing protein n=1 Tax=Neorhizobium lilium TaxID=2503024 RepID=A0A3S4UR29_9HYPH|nr:DUF3445 domain-containing protein [Neorhizobium lilium]RWX79059.1 DUF3445 domain-containing protein [Neorhizobium lilium]
MKLAHTPYDGSSKPFTIGLSQLDPDRWIEPDEHLAEQVEEKRRLLAEHGEQVFRAEPDTQAAQAEILQALIDYLPARHPAYYRRDGNRMQVAGRPIDLTDATMPALQCAGFLVQDDLVLMRRGENGWRIAAALLAFPSSWSLQEKFGKVMDEVHAPVPDFGAGSRNADLINRMFDNLAPGRIVVRWNWSVNWRAALYHPAPTPANELASASSGDAVIRVERQTLRKLSVSGDILFTIRIYLDPVKTILAQPNAAELAASLAAQLEALTIDQARYKGLVSKRNELIRLLRAASQPAVLAESEA